MFYTQEDLNIIRNSITSRQVAEYYGAEIRRNSMLCPLPDHNDTHFGSCNFGKNGSLHCYVCDKTIDPISLTMNLNSIDFPTAVNQLADMIGYVKYQPNKKQKQKDELPVLSNEEKILLGLTTKLSSVKIPSTIGSFKPDGKYEMEFTDSDEEVYIGFSEVTVPFNQLMKDDPEAYVSLVLNKCNEQICACCENATLAQNEKINESVLMLKQKYDRLIDLKGKFLKTSVYKKGHKAVGHLSSFISENAITGGYSKVYCLSEDNFKTAYTLKEVSKFILQENLTSEVNVFDDNNELLLSAAAFHIDFCADPEYKKGILKSFLPMQKAQIEEFFPSNILELEETVKNLADMETEFEL